MPRWQVPAEATFRWREWDGEHVLYHDESGDTHFLNALGRGALDRLRQTAWEGAELAAALAQDAEIEATPDFLASVDDLLAQFYDLGLIEPALPDGDAVGFEGAGG